MSSDAYKAMADCLECDASKQKSNYNNPTRKTGPGNKKPPTDLSPR
jgi:hypothetical protein